MKWSKNRAETVGGTVVIERIGDRHELVTPDGKRSSHVDLRSAKHAAKKWEAKLLETARVTVCVCDVHPDSADWSGVDYIEIPAWWRRDRRREWERLYENLVLNAADNDDPLLLEVAAAVGDPDGEGAWGWVDDDLVALSYRARMVDMRNKNEATKAKKTKRRKNPVPLRLPAAQRELVKALARPTPVHAPSDGPSWRGWAFVPWLRFFLGRASPKFDQTFAFDLSALVALQLVEIRVDPDQEALVAKADLDRCPVVEDGGEVCAILWVRSCNEEPDVLELAILEAVAGGPAEVSLLLPLAGEAPGRSPAESVDLALARLSVRGLVDRKDGLVEAVGA